jgi:hypothetical protein
MLLARQIFNAGCSEYNDFNEIQINSLSVERDDTLIDFSFQSSQNTVKSTWLKSNLFYKIQCRSVYKMLSESVL